MTPGREQGMTRCLPADILPRVNKYNSSWFTAEQRHIPVTCISTDVLTSLTISRGRAHHRLQRDTGPQQGSNTTVSSDTYTQYQ